MIYLDNNATTQVIKEVADAIIHVSKDLYCNPSSSAAPYVGADKPRQEAAAAMAQLLGMGDTDCLTFTSCATESNNWVFGPIASNLPGRTIVISSIEHPSIAEPAENLQDHGFKLRVAPVDSNGSLDLDAFEALLSPDVALVSIIAANNETGVLQPIPRIGALVRQRAPMALFHTDATQAVGKIPIDLENEWETLDLLSFSAHKFHGPKGLGGLFARAGIELSPLLLGGGQENGRRAGTLNNPALAGLAVAAQLANKADTRQVTCLRGCFETQLLQLFRNAIIHSEAANRLPNTSCFSIPGIVAEEVAEALAATGIIIGTGSACSSGALRPPKTLLAMGVNYQTATAALRLSLSRQSTEQELSMFFDALERIANRSVTVA